MVRHDEVHGAREDKNRKGAERLIERIGRAIVRLDVWAMESPDDERYVVGINIKVRYDDQGDVLIVVRADAANGPEVAFNTGDTISAALTGLANRLDNRTLKWREDTPWEA